MGHVCADSVQYKQSLFRREGGACLSDKPVEKRCQDGLGRAERHAHVLGQLSGPRGVRGGALRVRPGLDRERQLLDVPAGLLGPDLCALPGPERHRFGGERLVLRPRRLRRQWHYSWKRRLYVRDRL